MTGVSSGFSDLDKMTAGFQSGDLIIVAARPSMGKTTFAMNLCEYAALNENKPVLIFSLEMPSEQIMMRMLASLGRVDQTKIRTANWMMMIGRGCPLPWGSCSSRARCISMTARA